MASFPRALKVGVMQQKVHKEKKKEVYSPFTLLILILTHQQQTVFENIVGMGEIAFDDQYLLFPQCFLLKQTVVSSFIHIFAIISLFSAELSHKTHLLAIDSGDSGCRFVVGAAGAAPGRGPVGGPNGRGGANMACVCGGCGVAEGCGWCIEVNPGPGYAAD